MADVKRPKSEGGPWNDPNTWQDGVVPGPDDVVSVGSATTPLRPDGTVSLDPLDFIIEPEDRHGG